MTDRDDVFGLGQACVDYLGLAPAYPAADAKCELDDLVLDGGGPVANALTALSRWGLRCAFAGVVGDDGFGAAIRASLESERIDTAGLRVRAGGRSQFAFIAVEPSLGRRTVFWRRPTGDPPAPEEIDLPRVRAAGAFHTDGLFAEASVAAATAARESGVPVVVDAGTLRPGMLELAAASDWFIASESFARDLTGDDDPFGACRRLAESGPAVTGVTLGERGAVALVRGREITVPAYPVRSVDTTGCGDVFHAGVTYGVVRGWDVERSLGFASWAAARTSTKPGGRAGIPPLRDGDEIVPAAGV